MVVDSLAITLRLHLSLEIGSEWSIQSAVAKASESPSAASATRANSVIVRTDERAAR